MVHQASGYLLGACAGVALALVVTWVGLGAIEFAEWLGRRLRRNADLGYQSYMASKAIGDLKRRAVHEMLAAERECRNANSNIDLMDIIESTAIEVRR